MVKTTNSKSRYSLASYQPDFPKSGRYAVYVSYQTVDNSIDNAEYTVWHKGERTVFHVNQRMGGGTCSVPVALSSLTRGTVSSTV